MIDRMTILIISLVSLFFMGILIFVGFNINSQDSIPVADTGSPDIREFYGAGDDAGVVRNDPSIIDRMFAEDEPAEEATGGAPTRPPERPEAVVVTDEERDTPPLPPSSLVSSVSPALEDRGSSAPRPVLVTPAETGEPIIPEGALAVSQVEPTPSPSPEGGLPSGASLPPKPEGVDSGPLPLPPNRAEALAILEGRQPSGQAVPQQEVAIAAPPSAAPPVAPPPVTVEPVVPSATLGLGAREVPQETPSTALLTLGLGATDEAPAVPTVPNLGVDQGAQEPARPALVSDDVVAPSDPPPAATLFGAPPAPSVAPVIVFDRPAEVSAEPAIPSLARPDETDARPATGPVALSAQPAASSQPDPGPDPIDPAGDTPVPALAPQDEDGPIEAPLVAEPALPLVILAPEPTAPSQADTPSPDQTPPPLVSAADGASPGRDPEPVTEQVSVLTVEAPRLNRESDVLEPGDGLTPGLVPIPGPSPAVTPSVTDGLFGVPATDGAQSDNPGLSALAPQQPTAETVPGVAVLARPPLVEERPPAPSLELGLTAPVDRQPTAPPIALSAPDSSLEPDALAPVTLPDDGSNPTVPAPSAEAGDPVPTLDPAAGSLPGSPLAGTAEKPEATEADDKPVEGSDLGEGLIPETTAVASEAVDVAASTVAEAIEEFVIGAPLACRPGVDCFIQAYADVNPGQQVEDFTCGDLAVPGRSSTNFRLSDFAAMTAEVPVLAVADGVVTEVRSNATDWSPAEAERLDRVGPGEEAGNFIQIDHGNGWWSRVDHLAEGSVQVRTGQQVLKGEVLGLVGLTGLTNAPQVALTLWKDGAQVDPFLGQPGLPCGVGGQPLWTEDFAATLRYQPAAAVSLGLAGGPPNGLESRLGTYPKADQDLSLASTSPAIVAWANLVGVREGDRLAFVIQNGSGDEIFRETRVLETTAASFFAFAGRRSDQGNWPAGDYTVQVTLVRDGAVLVDRSGSVPVL